MQPPDLRVVGVARNSPNLLGHRWGITSDYNIDSNDAEIWVHTGLENPEPIKMWRIVLRVIMTMLHFIHLLATSMGVFEHVTHYDSKTPLSFLSELYICPFPVTCPSLVETHSAVFSKLKFQAGVGLDNNLRGNAFTRVHYGISMNL